MRKIYGQTSPICFLLGFKLCSNGTFLNFKHGRNGTFYCLTINRIECTLFLIFKIYTDLTSRSDHHYTEGNEMEYWDIYDKDKKLTGRTMKRNDWHMADGDYHLTVLGIVVTKDGRYLVTKRKADKEWAPGAWEVSGGGVQAGETSEEAVRREVLEETGVDVSQALSGGYVFTYRRDNPEEKNNYFVDVYRFVCDIDENDIHPQESETDGFLLVDIDAIRKEAEKNNFLHYDSIKQALY